ncbi:histidine kinase [Spirosoma terrae]|uniref:Sensor histidine kinase n=1 Tax=Spirosoma terrae TaxID=1968276 RepID=A0A6L9L727_9BACT|nr:histidine kinase [Spirosoma terrae]NDU95317.1 sensor histidine kinase [Spirosoma terrae]
MAATLFSRRYVSVLSHLLGWGLMGYLLFFYQPLSSEIKFPRLFFVRQVIFLGLVVGTFYLNGNVFVPRLLLPGHTGRYLLALTAVITLLVLILGGIEIGFNLAEQMHRAFHPDGSGKPKLYGWIQPSLFTIVLVLGISTSMSLLQKWQTDANLRLALEQAKTSSELSFLKAQINPHFFFNTLNNIYALTLIDAEMSREALHRLSRMMRYVLYETQSGTTLLSKEIDFISDYIQLMQLRLTDKVTVALDTPSPLHDQPIAPMIFLPFVENAFKHGVSTLDSSKIQIRIHQKENQLKLDVSNTLFQQKVPSLESGNGIGLTNTRRRLDLLYPDRYVLLINEDISGGEYEVHLTLELS